MMPRRVHELAVVVTCTEGSIQRRNVMLRLNVSRVQLVANGSVRTVTGSIDEFGIDAGSVCPEITERFVVSDIEDTEQTLARR
jgi:diguanylate cyclase